jgi:hypothetical protein
LFTDGAVQLLLRPLAILSCTIPACGLCVGRGSYSMKHPLRVADTATAK